MARSTLFTHQKFRRLVHMLAIPEALALGCLEFLWHVSYESGNALIGDAVDVELAARWPGEHGKLCKALVDVRLLDEVEPGRYAVHDLLDHAPSYVAGRARREEERQKEKSCANCGSVFHSTEAHARFCCNACRQADYNVRKRSGVTESDAPLRNCYARVTESYAAPTPNTQHPTPTPKEEKHASHVCSESQTGDIGAGTSAEPREAGKHHEENKEPSPIVLTFPTVGKRRKEWHLCESKLTEYRESFPDLDVLAECRKALQWCRDNPTKRKTATGMPPFLTRWLGKAQNSCGGRSAGQPAETLAQRIRRISGEGAG
jgi:hypothetical protein